MKRQGHTSLRRASLDRISLRKKKRPNMDTTSIVDHVEREMGNGPGFRTATHKTSHHQFLNWVTYSRDLSPDITEEQQRTCPVCETEFRDRRSMLQHICVCPQLSNGFYRCIHCNKKERIGRYHMNGCSDVRVCQDNWLKRMLSFRTSEVFVDNSETSSIGVDSQRAPWERIELPSETFAGLDARQYRVELATNEPTFASAPTAELDADWPALDLNSGAEAWGPIELPPWQSTESEEYYAGWPVVEMDGGWIPAEMPSWQPVELPGEPSDHPNPAPAFELHHRKASNLISLPAHGANHAHMDHDPSAVGCENIDEQSTDHATAQAERPNLRLEIENFAAQWQCSHEIHGDSASYHNTVGDHVRESFPRYEEYSSHNNGLDAQFPSPPTSPIIRYQHDTPVSPIEESLRSFSTSRSSRFSSLSSVLLNDTPATSCSYGSVSVEDKRPSAARMFEDREMCFEPDEMEYLPSSSSSADEIEEMMFHNSEDDTASTSSRSLEVQSTRTSSFDFDITSMSFQQDSIANLNLSTWSASSSLNDVMMRPATNAASFSPGLENDATAMNKFDVEFSSTSFHHGLSSPRLSSRSNSSWNPPSSTTTSGSSPNSEDDIIQSPKSDRRRPLARSPAIREVKVYRCSYGPCTFTPTGKRAYHKRTLQRHQEKCFYSPLPREKKPCKCTFPGCNKGFSRSDGLNAHRKTSGHQAKIELQLKEMDYKMREEVGFL